MKKVIIGILILIAIVGLIIFGVNKFKNTKTFELDYPEELPYKYFVMYSGDKAGVN